VDTLINVTTSWIGEQVEKDQKVNPEKEKKKRLSII
jgi:hypothetical protein